MSFISIQALYEIFKTCNGVSTDTRNIGRNSIFFALKGPNFNANTLAEKAIEQGASFAIVDEAEFVTKPNIILVGNGLVTLQDLANYHRKQFDIPVIGLTGSNGKTTTKELIYSVLSKKYKTHATKGNLNNHIGVPLTLLAMPIDTEMAIIEMGANFVGDIRGLVHICEPTHGLITNIGKAHLEGFGGIDGVKKGKGELFDWLSMHNGTVFINCDNQILLEMVSMRTFKKTVKYQIEDDLYNLQMGTEIPFVNYFSSQKQLIQTHLTGKYNFENIVNALAIGRFFGVKEAVANEAIANYQPDNNRSQFVQKGTNRVLMDAYNANPSSMVAAITNFNNLKAHNKMVILADMFELGEEGPKEHELLGELIKNCNFKTVLLAGNLMQNALIHLPQAYYFPDKFGLHVWLQEHPQTDAHILIKGSRGMALESCLAFI
jgi:UDP-N-acetylmuramoyl-tripeptide--D-alanyl-D-alanine ligase